MNNSMFPGIGVKGGGGTTPLQIKSADKFRRITTGKNSAEKSFRGISFVETRAGAVPQLVPGDGPDHGGKSPGPDGSRLCSHESRYGPFLRTSLAVDPAQSTEGVPSNVMDRIDAMSRIIGFKDIYNLLAPKHNWFNDKQAEIVGYKAFREPGAGNYYLYPKVGGLNGDRVPYYNPYRLVRLARSHTGQKATMVNDLIDKFKLDDFQMTFMTLTFPEQVSMWLSGKTTGRDLAWKLYGKYWAWHNEKFGPGLSGVVNLHTWSSRDPLKPHFHFHCLIPNYKLLEVPGMVDDDGDPVYGFEKQLWSVQKGGRTVPFSDLDLFEIKKQWYRILDKFVKKHKVPWSRMLSPDLGAKKIDIYVQYAGLNDEYGKSRMLHWFNYQGRNPIEDYAKYSNENLNCPSPPEWLTSYTNHARRFGWWLKMGSMVGVHKGENVKHSPLTGRRMDYRGFFNIYQVLNSGPLGFLDMVKGRPVFHQLNLVELNWLVKNQRKKDEKTLPFYYYGRMLTGSDIMGRYRDEFAEYYITGVEKTNE